MLCRFRRFQPFDRRINKTIVMKAADPSQNHLNRFSSRKMVIANQVMPNVPKVPTIVNTQTTLSGGPPLAAKWIEIFAVLANASSVKANCASRAMRLDQRRMTNTNNVPIIDPRTAKSTTA